MLWEDSFSYVESKTYMYVSESWRLYVAHARFCVNIMGKSAFRTRRISSHPIDVMETCWCLRRSCCGGGGSSGVAANSVQ